MASLQTRSSFHPNEPKRIHLPECWICIEEWGEVMRSIARQYDVIVVRTLPFDNSQFWFDPVDAVLAFSITGEWVVGILSNSYQNGWIEPDLIGLHSPQIRNSPSLFDLPDMSVGMKVENWLDPFFATFNKLLEEQFMSHSGCRLSQ